MDIKRLIKTLETKIAHSDDKLKIVVDVTDLQVLIQEIKLRNKMIDEMAKNLTTPINSKEWVKKYYEERCK